MKCLTSVEHKFTRYAAGIADVQVADYAYWIEFVGCFINHHFRHGTRYLSNVLVLQTKIG